MRVVAAAAALRSRLQRRPRVGGGVGAFAIAAPVSAIAIALPPVAIAVTVALALALGREAVARLGRRRGVLDAAVAVVAALALDALAPGVDAGAVVGPLGRRVVVRFVTLLCWNGVTARGSILHKHKHRYDPLTRDASK